MASIKLKGDTSGEITIQAPSVAGTNTLNLQASSGTLATTAQASVGTKNRIINGAMEIDQRNAGASITPTNSAYSLDRWRFALSQTSKLTCQQVSDAPAGFNKSLKVTSSSAYSPVTSDYFILQHRFEGYSTNDLGWGTSDAKTISVSFWVKSSLSGTFSGAIRNANGYGRGYVFEYTVNSSNTWEQKSVTITGDTSGSWAVDNSVSIELGFILGGGSDFYASPNTWNATNDFLTSGSTNLVATSGATLNITGVQLEVGTEATPFENRMYSTELALCQRYYEKSYNQSTVPGTGQIAGAAASVSSSLAPTQAPGVSFKVTKRANPTMVIYNGVTGAAGYSYRVSDAASVATTFSHIGEHGAAYINIPSSANGYYFHFTAASEL